MHEDATAALPMVRASIGHASDTSGKRRNEDFFGSVTPLEQSVGRRGILLAIADGLSGGAGRAAAEAIVYSVLTDYYSTPDNMSTRQALGAVIGAVNRWLYAQNNQVGEDGGMLTTLSALVLSGERYTIAHVGDTRIYRLRGGILRQLTPDHVWRSRGQERVLRRALGLDAQVLIDYCDGELEVDDVFLMASDGVWETMSETEMVSAVGAEPSPQLVAQALVEQAVLRGSLMSANDATLAVIRIETTAF